MKVSVCMATHNGKRYLREQLDSILIQLGQDDELIISDDGSTDDTEAIIKSYSDRRILFYTSPVLNNTLRNFENALTRCSGDVIFLSDQDDIWSEDKMTKMKAALQDCDLVLCDCSLVNNQLQMMSPSFYQLNRTRKGVVNNFIKNGYIGCCMAFNRKVLERALPFPSNIPIHDQWIGLVAEKYFKTKHIPDKLVHYRRHESSSTTTGRKSEHSLLMKLKNRYIIFSRLMQLGI